MASTRYTGDDADLRGWLVHDERFCAENLSAADSSYTQAGPRAAGAGTPTSAATAAVVEASGDQDDTLVVECLQGGFPRLGSARYGYRLSSEAATKMRGWQPPNVITHSQISTFGATARTHVSALTLRNGKVLHAREAAGSLVLELYDPATSVVDLTITEPTTSIGADGIAMALDDAGRVLLLCETTNVGWTLYRSAVDDPETWTEIARHMFANEPASGTYRLRMFIMPGGDIALLGFTAGAIAQWASSDGGATFTRIASDTYAGNIHDAVLTPGGRLGLFKLSAGGAMTWQAVTSAWSSVYDVSEVSVSSGAAEAWAAADPVGRIYTWIRSSASADVIAVRYSDDEGVTWTVMDSGPMDHNGDANQYITGGQAVHCLGAFILNHQASDNVGTADPSIYWTRLGGFSNVVLQGGETVSDVDMLGSGYGPGSATWTGCSWLPICEPDDLSCWTATGADGDDSMSVAGLTITTAAASRYFVATTAPVAATTVQITECCFKVTSGGSTASALVGAWSRMGDGATAVTTELRITASTTAFAVFDASGSLASVSVDMTAPMCFRIVHFTGAAGEVFYRRPYESTWTSAYASSSLTTAAAAAGYIRWGHTANATATSVWYYAWQRNGQPSSTMGIIGSPLTSLANQSWMVGRALTGLPAPIDELAASSSGEGTQVTYIRGTDGPAVANDEWTLTPRYNHPVKALLPLTEPSPRRTWRSTGVGSDSEIGFVFDSTNDTSLSRNIGLAAFNCNVRYVYLEAWTGAAWSTRATLDLATGLTSLGYTRTGNILRINGTADATRYIWRNELVGATVKLDATYYRKIARHTEGLWSDAAGKHVEIVLDGVTGSEPASGTMDIYARSGVVVVHGESTAYDKWRIRTPAQTLADSYQEIGTIIVGPLVVPGQSHSWGSTATYEPNASAWESVDGVSRARKRGPVVRTLTWAWSDGVDISRLRDASPTPNYLAHTSTTEGIANLNDTPYLVAGLLEECRSGEIPVVALEYISNTSGTVVTDLSLFMGPARIVSSVGVEHIQGDPEADAVYRISPVTMRSIA